MRQEHRDFVRRHVARMAFVVEKMKRRTQSQ